MKKIITILVLVLSPLAIFSQTSASATPDSANAGQTLDVTITGINTHFQSGSGTSVYFYFDQLSGTTYDTPNYINILNDTSLVANITISSDVLDGDYYIYVNDSIDGDVTSFDPNFHVNGVIPPSITSIYSITPSSANAGQTLDVTITGVNTSFQSGSGTAVSFGFGQGSSTINSLFILSETSITANITVPTNSYSGYYDVNVENSIDGYLTLNGGLYINGYNPPAIFINPATATPGQTLNVTISGSNTHFNSGSGTSVSFNFNQASGTTVINSQQILTDSIIQLNITVPSNTSLGYYNVDINNSIDGLLTSNNNLQVINPNPPLIVATKPGGAKAGQTLNVTITGVNTHFNSGSTTVSFDFNQLSGTTLVNSFTVINNTSIIANLTVPAKTDIGQYSVSVNNPIDGTIWSDFYVYDNCFSHYTASYNQVNNQFKLTLDSVTTALGKNFYWTFGDGATSTDETPTHTFTADQLYNVYLRVTNANGDTCFYSHEIGKDGNGNVVRSAGFSMGVVRYDGSVGVAQISDSRVEPTVYPNPFSKQTTLALNKEVKNAIVRIVDVTGKEVKNINFSGTTVQIEKGNLNAGLYFIQVVENNRIIATAKMMIQ